MLWCRRWRQHARRGVVLSNFISIQPQPRCPRQLQLENTTTPRTSSYRAFEDWSGTPRTSRARSTCGWWRTRSEEPADLGDAHGRRPEGRHGGHRLPVAAALSDRPHHARAPAVRRGREGEHAREGHHLPHRLGRPLGSVHGRDALRHDWPVPMETVYSHWCPTARGTGKASRRRNSVRAVMTRGTPAGART
ncbi:hypothetical protein HBB16_16525 [Pseudonocardia sp. MCCB 268]|nr:hypothetical protein [Pseudonocardia cytotoxica]